MEALKGIYHADKLDEQSFIDNFVIRLKEFRQIMNNLEQQKKRPLQHFLITGKRGMGKSTLLRRIYIEASKEPLNKKLLVVRLGAEQYRLSRLFKLWEMVIEQLSRLDASISEKKKSAEKNKHYEESLLPIINDVLKNSNKTLLLLIDNFDQFIEKIPPKDQHALREALMLYPIQIIGNTVFYNEHFKSYDSPFFDFFKPVHLDNLDKEEAEEFIKLRAANEGIENFDEIFNKQKGKINALRILSGGVPRTLIILLSIVSRENTGNAVEYLQEMIGLVTPLYQDRMKALSAQQQEIMHHLAMRWDRTPVKELAGEMRIPSKSISAQLLMLERSGYIKKVDVPGRNHYYEIDERFFNIWLLMSEAPAYDSKRVIWLTKWLDAFYSDEELKAFAGYCMNSLKKTTPGNKFLICQALSESEKLEAEYKIQFIGEVERELNQKIPEAKIWADVSTSKIKNDLVKFGNELERLVDNKNFEEALKRLDGQEKLNPRFVLYAKGYIYHANKDLVNAEKYYLLAAEQGDVDAMVNLGWLYKYDYNNPASAEKYWKKAMAKGDATAMFNLGVLSGEKTDKENEKMFFLMAAENGDREAMFNLGILFSDEEKDLASAEKYYVMAANLGHSPSMINLAHLYVKKSDLAASEKYLLMATEKGNIKAMFNLGVFYYEDVKDITRAEKYLHMAAERGHVGAMFNLGFLYENDKNDVESAEKYYIMAGEGGHVGAPLNLGNLYYDKGNIDEAEKFYLQAIKQGNDAAMVNLANLYYDEKNDLATAEKYYQEGVNKGDAFAMNNLANLYFETNNISQKRKALELSFDAVQKSEYQDITLNILQIKIALWNEKIIEASQLFLNLLNSSHHTEENLKDFSDAFVYFLVFGQRHFLHKTFAATPELIDRYKPVYYALLHESKEEYHKEYLKMTPELEEPVDAILKHVREEQKRLGR